MKLLKSRSVVVI